MRIIIKAIYFISKEQFINFSIKIENLSKLSNKLGYNPVKIFSKEEFRGVFPDGIRFKDYYRVVLEGEAPMLYSSYMEALKPSHRHIILKFYKMFLFYLWRH